MSEIGDMQPSDVVFPMAVMGYFKDYRNFIVEQIQNWVNTRWFTNEDIKVGKSGKTFFFYRTHEEDRHNLLARKNTCYQGALLVLKCWFPSVAIRSFDFFSCPIPVRVEGIPLTCNRAHVAERALMKLGRIICCDEASLSEGPKEFICAEVYMEVDKIIILGYFYEYVRDHFKWIDFRYEGVFIFGEKCGKIGHKISRCKLSMEEAHRHFGI